MNISNSYSIKHLICQFFSGCIGDIQKVLSLTRKEKHRETFLSGNTVPLLIKLEKLIEIFLVFIRSFFHYIYIYIYIGSISSLMQILLNIIDILCLHIFFWIRSNSRITFIVFGVILSSFRSILGLILSTRDTYNYGQYINQFPTNTIKVIREFERIQKKICRHEMSIMFNEICIYIYIYIQFQYDR